MLADEGKMLKSFIQYEFGIANMELASSWKKHGYNFQMMPNAFIEHIQVTPTTIDGKRYSLQVIVEATSFKEEPEDKVEFFKQYVLENALTKMRTRFGG